MGAAPNGGEPIHVTGNGCDSVESTAWTRGYCPGVRWDLLPWCLQSPQRWRRAFNIPTTRLWTFSDLHLEYARNAWSPVPPRDGFDAIVAAGDVAQQLPQALAWLHDRFPGVAICYTPGNHDYWNDPGVPGLPWRDILDQGRDLAARWGIHLLSDDAVTIGNVRFLRTTLWTDFRLGHDHAVEGFAAAKRSFNDYRYIRRPSGRTPRGRHILPAGIFDLHRASRLFLEEHLALPHDGPTVVVTHHAPHPTSVAGRERDGLDHVYASDLTPVILAGTPDLWVHGHVHGRKDYRVDHTRIVANARGHVGRETSPAAFDPALVLEV